MKTPLTWLREFVSFDASIDELAAKLTMAGIEVEEIQGKGDRAIFTLGITPNRPDCLSVLGVAREVAAVGGKLKKAKTRVPSGKGRMKDFIAVQVENETRCPRYTARIIKGVRIAPSPPWLVQRLEACGIRSVNNVVDATNYVMLERGQPLHAFDLRDLREQTLRIQTSSSSLTFQTLDGVSRKLEREDLLICDGKGPVALAGIMGGKNSEIHAETFDLLLESAYFEPAGIRRSSRRLGLSTESSYRFERGVDPNAVLETLHRLTQLITELAGGTPTEDWLDLYRKKILPAKISLSFEEVRRVLGMTITSAECVKLLQRLQFRKENQTAKQVTFEIPTFRQDLSRPIDLIEEIARIYGYGHIPETLPRVALSSVSRPEHEQPTRHIRTMLTTLGFSEAVLMAFISPEEHQRFTLKGYTPLLLTNPLSPEDSCMRTSLLPGLLRVMRLNKNHQQTDGRFFSMGRVYHREEGKKESHEPLHLAGLMMGRRSPRAWETSRVNIDFFDLKGVLEQLFEKLHCQNIVFDRKDIPSFFHPGISASITVQGTPIGYVGRLHPSVIQASGLEEEIFAFELNVQLLLKASHFSRQFLPLSRFPFVDRDFSIVIGENVTHEDIEHLIREMKIPIFQSIHLFDFYRGKNIPSGKKSVAYSLRYASHDRTLTDEEVTKAHQMIVQKLQTSFKAELRT
ncbi:MAG: phenylalanine--tRNA ligase subunit beta [Deltaproteobacteria bacterium RIFCSPLOWO2_02_FULL_44_10]|nr:MAG: phenylalanine--tRNA ligase subunit beta [Deltaproteobacteria bacterium RIFCSPHIGHO2_02_FULL_44_16]OGQ47399.1 MAG: phenylalanine--tRNA ligase subunit beta [Deltaproteobacteria bacterium RIFCSPLOWO2_02_FULL_44_10]